MSLLRIILAFWLSLAVPTAALASAMNEGHCQRANPIATAAASGHGQHAMHAAMQGEHAQHMVPAGKITKSEKNPCSCGCNCSGTHCATSCGGAMASGGFRDVYSFGPSFGLSMARPAQAVAAHTLDLLRPPSLT
ncbi:MAG: hypothetical protein ACRETN_13140 [Nevskiales bacterium]